jgi:hypothetical protein
VATRVLMSVAGLDHSWGLYGVPIWAFVGGPESARWPATLLKYDDVHRAKQHNVCSSAATAAPTN